LACAAGFAPHPKISYAGAAPTGAASEAEYLELSLTRACAAPEVRERLDAALPDGIDVIEVTEGPVSLGALPLEASLWQAVLPGVSPQQAGSAVTRFLACESVEVERLTTKGPRRVDARAAVLNMAVDTACWPSASGAEAAAVHPARRRPAASPEPTVSLPAGPPAVDLGGRRSGVGTGNATLRMVVRHVIPAVRPDDIFTALCRVAALAPSSPPVVTRLAQGALTAGAGGAGVILDASWRPSASGAQVRGALPGTAPQPPGRRVVAEKSDTTRLGPERGTATVADTIPAGACDQLPRGAEQPVAASAPGSLTGDCPNARQRATRDRARQ